MNTLMHVCCAPCANRPMEILRTDGIDLTLYWYNPNIHPFTEYRARRNCLLEYANEVGVKVINRDEYGLRPFVEAVAGDLDHRCGYCYTHRLEETARYAAEHGFSAFTTTLLASVYQRHDDIAEAAERLGREYGVSFLYRDFRPNFRAGNQKARELGFYMQKYCGCVFSEEERYIKAKKIIP